MHITTYANFLQNINEHQIILNLILSVNHCQTEYVFLKHRKLILKNIYEKGT